MTQGPQGP